MAKKKFYAVKIGRKPGIYGTWTEAEQQVKGFPGAIYQSFSDEEAANSYISSEISDLPKEAFDMNEKIQKEMENLKDGEVIAFVDGSHSLDADGKEKYSFGAVIITNESEDSLYKAFVNSEYMGSRNIAGEIEGVRQVISWAVDNKKTKIRVFYDYEGIEKWATKEWKAKIRLSQEYSKFFDEKSKLIEIEFEHVKAHSGISYNERADELAKKALLAQGYKTHNDGSVYFIGFEKNDWLSIIDHLNNEEFNCENNSLKIKIEEKKPKAYMSQLNLVLGKDKLVINCYNGSKSYVQGRQSILFEKIIFNAIEKLPTDNAVIEVLNNFHALTIKEFEVENAFSNILPDFSCGNKDIRLRNTLLSAVFNTITTGYMPDYTCLIFPLFRAMEFYLHRILGDKLGNNTTRVGKDGIFKGNNFSFFSTNTGMNRYEYNGPVGNLNSKQIDYLNELYNRYNQMRHPYFHWRECSMDTHVISDINTAHDLINDGLKFINKYYIIF